jgi:uncharacterized peroxidase-related enzyme
MAHVSYLEKDQAAESIRPVYDSVAKSTGHMLNMFKALAHSPDVFQSFLGLNSAFGGKMKLDPKYRELAYLKSSTINKCDYCLHYHSKFAAKAGLSERQIKEVGSFETSDAYDEHQKSVLRYVESVTRSVRADDALVGRLKEFLSDRDLVELTLAVALANFTNRINEALQIELP